MSSLSSGPFVIHSVATTPNVFELSRPDARSFCASPTCINSHQTIAFGDLADLKSVNEAKINDIPVSCLSRTMKRFISHRLYRNFSVGNYSVSAINFDPAEVKPMIIFHQENVDPSLVATVLLGSKDDDYASGTRKRDAGSVDKTSNFYVIDPRDWFSTTRLAANTSGYKKRGKKRMKVDAINKEGAPLDSSPQRTSSLAASLKLVWKKNPGGDGADLKTSSLDDLFYFVNGAMWFAPHYQRNSQGKLHASYSDVGEVEISGSSREIYQLRAQNKIIGIAINTKDVFGDAEVAGALIQDPYGVYYALVLHGFVDRQFGKFVFPVESFLYENVYRSFFKSNEEIENPYYGHEDSESKFALLPDTLFVKILLYLPWRHRIQCRRVNKRWLEMANLATAIDTKVIDSSAEQYEDMQADDLKWLLPIVSDYLEEFIWRNGLDDLNFDGIRRVAVFPKLKRIDVNENELDFDDFISLLDKCPRLKELTASIPSATSSSTSVATRYEVEKLCLIDVTGVTDSWLIEITNYFPKLTQLHIDGHVYLTSTCLSTVVEKYVENLRRLEVHCTDRFDSPTTGALTNVGECHNLEYLSLVCTDFISNYFMTALAAGCHKLTTLDINESSTVTNEGLAALAALPNLTRLDVSNVGDDIDLSLGISQLAKAGHLEQLLVQNAMHPSAACLKTCVRYCRHLKSVDITESTADITADDAKEIIRLYGTWSLNSRLVVCTDDRIWRKRAVKTVRNEVTETCHRRFVITPCYGMGVSTDLEGDKWVMLDGDCSNEEDSTESDEDDEIEDSDDSFGGHFDGDDYDDGNDDGIYGDDYYDVLGHDV